MNNETSANTYSPRTVVVTGGSRGIGLEIAKQFQLLGDKVIITYNHTAPAAIDANPPAGHDDSRELYKLHSFSCDVTSSESIDGFFTYVENEFGTPDVLILAAGINDDSLLIRMGEDKWSNVIDTNLNSAYKITHRVLPSMIRRRSGRIILISSVVAMMGNAGQTNYAAAKAGLIGFGRSLAREVAARSITVNIVIPGLTDTDMLSSLSKEQLDALASKIPMGRIGTTKEVAAGVKFLASQEASYITGAVIPIDGGLVMGY